MRTNIRRGSIVFSVTDPRHDGIVLSLHLCSSKRHGAALFANVRWLETGWLSHRVPVTELRLAPIEHGPSLISAHLRQRLAARDDA